MSAENIASPNSPQPRPKSAPNPPQIAGPIPPRHPSIQVQGAARSPPARRAGGGEGPGDPWADGGELGAGGLRCGLPARVVGGAAGYSGGLMRALRVMGTASCHEAERTRARSALSQGRSMRESVPALVELPHDEGVEK